MNSPSPPKIKIEAQSPHTPQLHQAQWSPDTPETDSMSCLSRSPDSPAYPMTPTSPKLPSHTTWGKVEGQPVRVVGLESPRSNFEAHVSLSRQSSRKRQPIKVGDLLVGNQIGAGAFSRTYQAYGSREIYAVKTRLPSTDANLFTNESRILTKLVNYQRGHHMEDQDQHIIKFFPELSEQDNLVFKLYNTNLDSLVHTFKRDPNEFDFFDFRHMSQPLVGSERWIRWSRQLVTGLEFIHSLNIVHADLKPDNVLVLNDQLYIADFSGSIDRDANPASVFTSDLKDGLAWSPVFTDPELRKGRCLPSAGSDIYSLGLVLAFTATGTEPYSTAKNATQRLMWMDKIDPLDSFDMDTQPRLSAVKPVIQKCLSRSLDEIDKLIDAASCSIT